MSTQVKIYLMVFLSFCLASGLFFILVTKINKRLFITSVDIPEALVASRSRWGHTIVDLSQFPQSLDYLYLGVWLL